MQEKTVKTIEDPDEIIGDVYTGNGGNPQNAITFRKNINGRESVFTYIAAGPHDLRILTIYKGAQKKSLAASTDVQASVLTSKTSRGTAPMNNLSQKNEESNKKGSLTAAADPLNPALTSETADETTSESIVAQEEDPVKRVKEAELDREYLQAIKDGNKKKQWQMIREKYSNTEGIYPFYSAAPYKGRAF